MAKRLKCKNCKYETIKLNEPYGFPETLVPKAIETHLMAFPNHELHIIESND